MVPTLRTRVRSWRAAARQWRFPRELRISPRDLPDSLDTLVRRAAAAVESYQPGREQVPARPAPAPSPLGDRDIATVATGLWRARRRMLDPVTSGPNPELDPSFRHVQSTWDALEDAGITIQDHDGTAYVTGLALDVVDFETTAGLEIDTVVETVRPSVYVQGRRIQTGQVIVGTPT